MTDKETEKETEKEKKDYTHEQRISELSPEEIKVLKKANAIHQKLFNHSSIDLDYLLARFKGGL